MKLASLKHGRVGRSITLGEAGGPRGDQNGTPPTLLCWNLALPIVAFVGPRQRDFNADPWSSNSA
jgi:hypothetical protein